MECDVKEVGACYQTCIKSFQCMLEMFWNTPTAMVDHPYPMTPYLTSQGGHTMLALADKWAS